MSSEPFVYTGHLPAPRPDIYFAYAILCENNSIYIGQTKDLRQRYSEHLGGRGADHTKKFKPVELTYYEDFTTREEAVAKEKEWKTTTGRRWLKKEYESGRARQAGKNRKPTAMPYWHINEENMEDRELMTELVEESAEITRK